MDYIEKNIISPYLQNDDELGRLFFLKRDEWEKMSHGEQIDLFNTMLKNATKSVLKNEYGSVEEYVKNDLSKIHTRVSYDKWKRKHSVKKYFLPKMDLAISECKHAKNLIAESHTDPQKAEMDLEESKFSYVDKDFVKSLMYKPPVQDTSVVKSSDASMGSGIVGWAKSNPKTALGLAALSTIGLFYWVNKNDLKKRNNENNNLKGLKLK